MKRREQPVFGNILLSGRCNLRCPSCIGRVVPRRLQPDNLDRFPLAGVGRFIARLRQLGIREVTLTGTNTDPLLYRHQQRLLALLRARIAGVRVNLHSNGLLAQRRPELVDLYDRATISLPSLRPATCAAMTGRAAALDLEHIVGAVRAPIKISTLVTSDNCGEIDEIVARCRELGIKRLVLRREQGGAGPWPPPLVLPRPARSFGGNPVFLVDGLEITLWDFARTELGCVNLFADGTVDERYALAERRRAA